MLRLYGCVTQEHDLRLVGIAVVICFLSSYTALSLLGRAAAAQPGWRPWWLIGAAIVAGSGVWVTHFVAMLAFRPGFAFGYDFGRTVLSIVIAMLMMWLAFAAHLRHRHEILSGTLFGVAVAAMHYTGMAALRAPVRISWDPVFVAASIAIGIGFATLALRSRSGGSRLRRRVEPVVLLTVAIAGLHFTGMAAASFQPDPLNFASEEVIAPEWLAVAISVIMIMIVALGLVGSFVDERFAEIARREADQLRAHLTEIEERQREIEATTGQLELALDAASAASRAKSQFLATVSHELRTPLNAIIGLSDLIRAGICGSDMDKLHEYVGDIHDSGEHLLKLINSILDISRIEAGKMALEEEAIDVAELVGSCLRFVAPRAAAAGIALAAELPPELPLLRADRTRLKQIVLNLLSNAIKFTPNGGRIDVTVACAPAGAMVIAVTDTGIGMTDAEVAVALEPFRQVDSNLARRHEGAGLGLPLTKTLIELHGGKLEIESAIGRGTVTRVSFPASRVGTRPSCAAA